MGVRVGTRELGLAKIINRLSMQGGTGEKKRTGLLTRTRNVTVKSIFVRSLLRIERKPAKKNPLRWKM